VMSFPKKVHVVVRDEAEVVVFLTAFAQSVSCARWE